MKILFATGGTAGHINPALAAASYIKERYPQADILFVGTADKMEARLVPAAGFAFQTIEIQGFSRSISPAGLKKNLITVKKLICSSVESKKIIEAFEPDVVVGFGGYVSGPVLQTAVRLGIPTCIHEQNAFPGVTNKSLAKKVDKVMLTVAGAQQYLRPKHPPLVTGLPVRGEILKTDRDFARAELGIRDNQILILSTGGSLGAKPINNAMLTVLSAHANKAQIRHIHSAGTSDTSFFEALQQQSLDKVKNLDCRSYIDNMDVCLSAADLVIGRAGASSLSELQALGKASILIPSPYVAENHQYHNAMAMVSQKAALILEEKELTGIRLTDMVDRLLADPEQLRLLADNAKAMAVADAREEIAKVILSLISA